jgi:CubicO group peptidase (beta-lactamase class C family)
MNRTPFSTSQTVLLRLTSLRLAAVFLLVFGWSAVPAIGQHTALEGLDAYVEQAMLQWDVPGVALAVVKNGEIIYERGFGTRIVGADHPVDAETLFPIASTTKAMTVAALGMLVDEGKLSWDDRVIDHLPGFRLGDPYVTRNVTVRDLLTHRTGMASHNNLWIASPFDRAEIVDRLRHLPSAGEFRGAYQYNNLMYMVAGEVVAAVSNMSWDDFMDKRLFIPLRMTLSTTRDDVIRRRENVAMPHIRVDGEVTPVDLRNYSALGPAGSAYSNAREMANWLLMHLNHGEHAGRRLIDSTTVASMHQPQVVMNQDNSTRALFPDRKLNAYALGWRVHDYHGRTVVQHTGLVNYTRTQVGFIPEENIGFVAFANLTTAPLPSALMYHVFDALMGESEADWSARYLSYFGNGASTSARAEAAATAPRGEPGQFVGRYEDALYGPIHISEEGGGLVLRYSDDYIADLEPLHYDTFRANWRRTGFGSANVTFSRNHGGEVRSLEMQGFTSFSRSSD